MKSNFGTDSNTISFFLDENNLFADRISRFWTLPIRMDSDMLIENTKNNLN